MTNSGDDGPDLPVAVAHDLVGERIGGAVAESDAEDEHEPDDREGQSGQAVEQAVEQ